MRPAFQAEEDRVWGGEGQGKAEYGYLSTQLRTLPVWELAMF